MKKSLTIVIVLMLCFSAFASEPAPAKWIEISPYCAYPDEETVQKSYPLTLTRGEIAFDSNALIVSLLGENYITNERGPYSSSDTYRSGEGQPWEYASISIDDRSKSFSYRDPWIAGERGGEYEPPVMGQIPEETEARCRELLSEYLPESFLSSPGKARLYSNRGSIMEHWMNDKEWRTYTVNLQTHIFVYEHLTEDGIPILDDDLLAVLGVNGLSEFTLNWHDFTASEETGCVMPLSEALEMCSSTRSRKTVFLYASLAYSNRAIDYEGDTFHLGWYIVTTRGDYFVDCVNNKHCCTMYEY